MNKKTLVFIIIGLILVGGVVFAYFDNQSGKKEQDNMVIVNKTEDESAVKKESDEMSEKVTVAQQGSYVTLADYDKNPSSYVESKKVYFFHASWCSVCQGIDKEINADTSRIPSGVTIIKTDFDSSIDLRKKYGVTTQYTFVQVDSSGNEIAQWSAISLQTAIDGIKS